MEFEGTFLVWTALAIFIPLMLSVSVPGVYRTWVDYRSRSQALGVLRVYAEKGEEPPASVTSALSAVAAGTPVITGAPAPPGAFPKPASTRESHLAHAAGSLVCGLGAAGIAWWRMPADGDPGALVIWAVVFAIFFAGSVAARMVGVFTAPSGRLRDDR
jgi:hypothetical protein